MFCPMCTEEPIDPILAVLMARGSRIRRVRYRENRSVLLSVSRDGRTLNSHACFRGAPAPILRAIAAALTERGARRSQALRRIRAWEGTRRGLERARRRSRPRRSASGTAPALQELYDGLNRTAFGGRLPVIPLRVSTRMTRALGTIAYVGNGSGERGVREIAIAADLLRATNREALEDTLLHEMAHAEAWLVHAHRGHGVPWKRVARRVGCRPRARTDSPIEGRGR